MNDDVLVILMLCVTVAFIMLIKGRSGGRRMRALQETVASLQAAHTAPPALPGPGREDVRRLEARVRVLERIVTDNGYTLASEIEALRDTHPHREPVQ